MLWDGIFINGLATYLPGRISAENGSGDILGDSNGDYGGFESITVSDRPAHVMAGLAAKRAVKLSDHRDEMFSPIVYTEISVPPEHPTPVCYVQRILEQRESLAFGLEAASDGGLTGIEVVARIVANNPSVNAGLLTAASRCVDGANRWLGGQPLGDGGAAVVISKKGGFARLVVSQRTSLPDLEVLHEDNVLNLDKRDSFRPFASFEPYIPSLARLASTTISATLAEANLSLEDVAYFCPPIILQPAFEAIYLDRHGIPIEKTCWSELQKNGHVGPCDQILGIAHLIDTGRLKQGEFIMLIGGGMGWRLTCLLIQVL
jgi:3-oxoacyl-[acyl-carrier-protein] synthase-3